MGEIEENIIQKTSNIVSRNTPVALVVGAAGFLGSHLADSLLEKGIQVIGVDNFKTGKKEHLENAIKNKNFHLISLSAENLDLNLPRLDYLFIVASGGWNVSSIFKLFKQTRCRCLLVSSIELYDSHPPENLNWFKETEAKLARFAQDNHLNARILRLGGVFGPRMYFRPSDPALRLIHAALTGKLQKETDVLDFSSRALYVSDAAELIVKSMFAGATAQKIFDGISPTPIKVSEIKQVLLDPVWYEHRGFIPSELPPWPTPNLDKTMKFLNWKPQVDLVAALRKTLSFYKDNEIKVPELEDGNWKIEDREEKKWGEEKREQLEAIKPQVETFKKTKQGIKLPRFPLTASQIYLFLALGIILYGLIWPILALSWGVLTFRDELGQAAQNLSKGDFDKSLKNINQAEVGLVEAKTIISSLEPIRKTSLFSKQFEVGDSLINLATLSTNSARSTTEGIRALYQGLEAVTGGLNEPPRPYVNKAQVDLAEADEGLSKIEALFKDQQFNLTLPKIILPKVTLLKEKLSIYADLVKKGRASAILLPKLVALDEASKSYLILFQNNNELRPGGGFIGSFAKVTFEGGKLKKLDVNDVYAIDGQLKLHVEPPKEIKEDLGQKDWFLRDSNWEPDFPTSARQAEWFYSKETSELVSGVIALDVSAIENLLTVVGSLDLADYNEKITAENLFEKTISHAEQGFFPGSQAKKTFLTALTHQLLNKIFFLPKQNWPGIVTALGQSLENKHLSIYLNDPKLFSYVSSQGWSGSLPRASDEKGGPLKDFLAPVEANLGANKANYYLERHYQIDTTIGKDGEVFHRLRINYLNRSPSDAFPAGKYKNRLRVYLPFSSKLTRALWGEADITKDVSSFVDYGRTGYSMLIEVYPKQQKSLILDYQLPTKLEFKDGRTSYRLDVIKQAGTLKDPLEWKVAYPINYQLISNQSQKITPQEQTIRTDLSRDRSFELVFEK